MIAIPRGITYQLPSRTKTLYACRSSAGRCRIIELYLSRRPADAVYALRRGNRSAAIVISDDDCRYLGERPDGNVVICALADHLELWGADTWNGYWKKLSETSRAVSDDLRMLLVSTESDSPA